MRVLLVEDEPAALCWLRGCEQTAPWTSPRRGYGDLSGGDDWYDAVILDVMFWREAAVRLDPRPGRAVRS